MSEYQVTAYVNVDPDNFFGWKPRHAIAKVDVFVIKASTPSQVREEMFSIGNRMGCDIHGKTWPSDVRSLSVGDLIEVRSPQGRTPSTVEYLSCDSVGWTDIPEPTNPIVALAGTAATSRPAPNQED